ncbi:hypothetical protein H4S08_004627 [Coemansia sp. RSA 1365]|nr:hypothetical protein H4S08_004627 [Coemansia sp. RSA 1365]
MSLINSNTRTTSSDEAFRMLSQAKSCVVLIGPGISQRLNIKDMLADPAIKDVIAYGCVSQSSVNTRALQEMDPPDARACSTIFKYCGELSSAPGLTLHSLLAELMSAHTLSRVYTDDPHLAVLKSVTSTPSERISELDSRAICIHGRVNLFVCKVCTAKSELTQAVLFKAMSNLEVTCSVCGVRGKLANGIDCAENTFVPDIYRAKDNARIALEMAQTDANAHPDVLLVLGVSDNASESWTAIASILAHTAEKTIVVGEAKHLPYDIRSLDKCSVVQLDDDLFARDYLANMNVNSENNSVYDNIETQDTSASTTGINSSAADSSDDRLGKPRRTASIASDLGKKPLKGSKKSKGRNREKTNLNHLLNFTLPAREPPPLPPLARSRRGAENTVSERQAEINRSVFINANFRFVLKARHCMTFDRIAVRPDMQLRPEWIERVIIPVAGDMVTCPICLMPPVAARVTKCGHVFCFSCILRHLSYDATNGHKITTKKCPICWCAISNDNLLPVQFWAAQYETSIAAKAVETKLGPGSHITMRLMKRLRGTTFCLPRASTSHLYNADIIGRVRKANNSSASDAGPKFDGSNLPWTFSDGALTFARFMLASRDFCVSEYQRELGELQQASSDEGADAESRLFILSAIMSVESALAEAQSPSIEERRFEDLASVGQNAESAHRSSILNTVQSVEDGTTSHGLAAEERVTTEKHVNMESDNFFYFYQADDGQHIYIHPLHMRILAHDRGNYSEMPDTLDIKLKYSIESVVTDEVRRRFRFLDHLSLRCEVVIIEPDISDLVLHTSLDKFRQQLSHHDKQHAARARGIALDEARSESAAAMVAAAQNGVDMGGYGNFENNEWSGVFCDGDQDHGIDVVESDAGNFPALGDNTPAESSTLLESGGNSRSNGISSSKRDALWPRQPLPNEFANNSMHNGLWDNFEKAAAMHGSRNKASDHDMGDAAHYEGHNNDPFDFSIPTKGSNPQSNQNKPSSKKRNGKKGLKLVLSGASTRRSR